MKSTTYLGAARREGAWYAEDDDFLAFCDIRNIDFVARIPFRQLQIGKLIAHLKKGQSTLFITDRCPPSEMTKLPALFIIKASSTI